MISIIVAQLLFAGTYLFGKLALNYSKPFFLTGFRTLIGSIFLFLLYYSRCDTRLKLNLNLLGKIFLMGIFYNYFAVALRFWALQYVPIGKASFIYNMSPFLTAILSAVFFKHRLTTMKIFGLIIGFLGFIPVFLNNSFQEVSLRHFGIFSTAELGLVCASVSAVIGSMLFKYVIEMRVCHFLFASSLSMFIGSILHIITSLLIEPWDPIPVSNVQSFFLWASILTFSSNIISYYVYGRLLKKYTASLMSFAGLLVPLFAALEGMMFLGEPIQSYFIPSIIVISCGLYIFYWQELKLGYISQ